MVLWLYDIMIYNKYTFNLVPFWHMEKEMATHSSILAWRIPRTAEPGGLLSMGSQRVGHNWSDLACMCALETEKAMAPYSSTLAWKIPWMEEPGRLQSMGSLRVGHAEQRHFHFSLSCIGEGNGNPLQCSCLENPRDRGTWWAAIYGVAQSPTRLKWLSSSSSTLEKEMATHSSVLVWRIPGTEEPGGLQSKGSHRVGHDWSDLAAAAAF